MYNISCNMCTWYYFTSFCCGIMNSWRILVARYVFNRYPWCDYTWWFTHTPRNCFILTVTALTRVLQTTANITTRDHVHNYHDAVHTIWGITVWQYNRDTKRNATFGPWPLEDLNKIFKLISVTDGWGISGKIALRWMALDLTDDKSTLVQVMAWCRQATSHYLIQCWPRFMSPYGVTRPQWVKLPKSTEGGILFLLHRLVRCYVVELMIITSF